jgi:hypothetical protein
LGLGNALANLPPTRIGRSSTHEGCRFHITCHETPLSEVASASKSTWLKCINASFRKLIPTTMPGFLLPYHALSFLLLGQLASCLDVPVLLTPPATASSASQSLLSLSIEQDRWMDWVGTTSRNDFFFNTLDNLQQLTGLPPRIRIGANSEDHTNFGDNVQVLYPSHVKENPWLSGATSSRKPFSLL